ARSWERMEESASVMNGLQGFWSTAPDDASRVPPMCRNPAARLSPPCVSAFVSALDTVFAQLLHQRGPAQPQQGRRVRDDAVRLLERGADQLQLHVGDVRAQVHALGGQRGAW